MAFAVLMRRGVGNRSDGQKQRQEMLYEAVKNRDQARMHAAIKSGADCKAYIYGRTFLHVAVLKPCSELHEQGKVINILEWFIKRKKFKVDARGYAHTTALHMAVSNGMIEVVDYLIGKGADLNAKDCRGRSMCHHMVRGEFERYVTLTRKASTPDELRVHYRESVQFFNQMLLKKIKVDCVDEDQQSSLHIAAVHNLLHVLPILLEYNQDVTLRNMEKKTALHLFAEDKKRRGNAKAMEICFYDKQLVIDILKIMLLKGYCVNSLDVNGNSPLHYAVYHEEREIFEIMLKKFKKVNACNRDGNSLLHLIIDSCIDSTCNRHHKDCVNRVRSLMSKGADVEIVNKNGYKPVHLAVMLVHPTILQILKDHGANLKEPYKGGNLLHLLAEKSSRVINCSKLEVTVGLLVSQGCDVNTRDDNGMAPIHLAVKSSRNDVIKILIKCHANVDARELSFRRLTPLQTAVISNNILPIETLVEVGADVNAKDSTGKTALHLAMRRKISMVRILLKLGAHVDVEDDDRLLPLHHAIRQRNDKALEELLKFGADINDMDTYRQLTRIPDPFTMLYGILEHWIMMKAAELPILPDYQNYATVDTFQELYQDCLREIEALKAHRIAERTYLYDFLHMDWNLRCAYTFHEPFINLVESTLLHKKFPHFHVLILAQYHQAVTRQLLLEPAKRAWCEFTKIYLPDTCLYRILNYLTNRDLRVMVEGLKDRCFRKPCNLLLNSKGRHFKS